MSVRAGFLPVAPAARQPLHSCPRLLYCRLQYFTRVFTATRFSFLEAVKEAISAISICGCCLCLCCPRPARVDALSRRQHAPPPLHVTPACFSTFPTPALLPPCPTDLMFMLLIMLGFAVAFHVLFRKDQQHEVRAPRVKPLARQPVGSAGRVHAGKGTSRPACLHACIP